MENGRPPTSTRRRPACCDPTHLRSGPGHGSTVPISCLLRLQESVPLRRSRPTLSWRYRMGPGLSRRMATAIRTDTGRNAMMATTDTATCKTWSATQWNGSIPPDSLALPPRASPSAAAAGSLEAAPSQTSAGVSGIQGRRPCSEASVDPSWSRNASDNPRSIDRGLLKGGLKDRPSAAKAE